MKKLVVLGLVVPAVWLASLGRGVEFGVPFADLRSIPYWSFGLLAFAGAGLVGLRRWMNWSRALAPLLLLALFGVLFWPCADGLPRCQYLALLEDQDWQTYWGLHFTPGFFVAPLLALLAAWAVGDERRRGFLWTVVAVASVLLLAEPFFIGGGMALVIGIALAVVGGGRSWKPVAGVLVLAWIACAVSCWFGRGLGYEILWPFGENRMVGYVPTLADLWCPLQNVGWWPWTGTGWLGYNVDIPNPDCEFVLLAAAQHYGKWTLVADVAAFASMAAASWAVVRNARTGSGKVLGLGMALSLLLPFAGNLLMLGGLLPLANTWVPFATDSRSALVAAFFAIGVLVQLALVDDEVPSTASFWRRLGYAVIGCGILCGAIIGLQIVQRKLCLPGEGKAPVAREENLEEFSRAFCGKYGYLELSPAIVADEFERNGVRVDRHVIIRGQLLDTPPISDAEVGQFAESIDVPGLKREIREQLEGRLKHIPRTALGTYREARCTGVNIVKMPSLNSDGSLQFAFSADAVLCGPMTSPIHGSVLFAGTAFADGGKLRLALAALSVRYDMYSDVEKYEQLLLSELKTLSRRDNR